MTATQRQYIDARIDVLTAALIDAPFAALIATII